MQSIKECLEENGVQPLSFAYFLTEYMKDQKKKKTRMPKLAKLLSDQLEAQAELINFHLTR